MTDAIPEVILIVMGVSGSGKSTIATLIAKMLHWPMVEGDDLHPPANIFKMTHHMPLDDEDRHPWLVAIGEQIDSWLAKDMGGIVTCSALKRRYRDKLIKDRPNLWFVYLKGSHELIEARLSRRSGHFMPPDLLDSQFADLEEPTNDEPAITVDVTPKPEVIVKNIIAELRKRVLVLRDPA